MQSTAERVQRPAGGIGNHLVERFRIQQVDQIIERLKAHPIYGQARVAGIALACRPLQHPLHPIDEE